jgi:opacity protein-like surface antigen
MMKISQKNTKTIFANITVAIALLLLCSVTVTTKAMEFGISAGLALPNDNISQFFKQTKSEVVLDNTIKETGNYLLDKAASSGYIVEAKGRIGLGNNLDFVIGIGMARFNEGKYDLTVPGKSMNDSTIGQIQSTLNVVPITAGVNVYLFKSFVNLYATGDITYNYMSYSYDLIWKGAPGIPISNSENDARVGYGIGAGIDFDLILLKANFEAKFNCMNLIGRISDEKRKNYGTFTVGIIF